MFYDVYAELCKRTGEKPYAVAYMCGAKSNSSVAQWQKGSVPRRQVLQNIADHFGVTVDYLLTGKQPTVTDGLSEESIMIANIIDALPPERRRLLLALVRELASAPADPASSSESP